MVGINQPGSSTPDYIFGPVRVIKHTPNQYAVTKGAGGEAQGQIWGIYLKTGAVLNQSATAWFRPVSEYSVAAYELDWYDRNPFIEVLIIFDSVTDTELKIYLGDKGATTQKYCGVLINDGDLGFFTCPGGGTEFTSSLGISLSPATWYKLRLNLKSGASRYLEALINGVSQGTHATVAEIPTGQPDAANRSIIAFDLKTTDANSKQAIIAGPPILGYDYL